MKVSFIVPAYNEEKYIADCIASIIAQKDAPEYEIIAVDNRSTDRTAEVLRRTFGDAIKVVEESQRGMCRARNRGAKEATGDIFVFFDADVGAPAGWVRVLRDIFTKQPQAVAAYGPYKFLDLPLRHRLFWEIVIFKIIYTFYDFIFNKTLHKSSIGVGGNFVVRADIFKKIGGWNENIEFCGEDMDLCGRLVSQGKVIFSPRLWVWESGRRLRKNGFRQVFSYAIRYISFFLTGKPRKESYTAIR